MENVFGMDVWPSRISAVIVCIVTVDIFLIYGSIFSIITVGPTVTTENMN